MLKGIRTGLAMACVAASLAAMGCASGKRMAVFNADFAATSLLTPQQRVQLEKAMTDQDIANMLDVDVQAKLPTRLAVARLQRGGEARHGYGSVGMSNVTLGVVGREELAGWKKVAASQPAVQGVRAVSPISCSDSSLTFHALRVAAARMDCELLLVYLQADGSVDNYNDAAVLYWTIAGLWSVPGNTYERKTVMQAVLVDCRTGMILATAAGQAQRKRDYAAAYEKIAKGKLEQEVPQAALTDLQANCGEMIDEAIDRAHRQAATQRAGAEQ